MPVIPYAEMVNDAFARGYAVPHFNVCNLETVQAVARGAAGRRSPVIFGIHGTESDHAGAENLVGLIRSEVEAHRILAGIHLDHGDSIERVIRSVRAGYTSVMFDGSMLPIDENLRITAEVVRVARIVGLTVEAEVGTIGRRGEYGEEVENPHLSDPADVERMAATGVDAVAVAIGNSHGVYVAEPRLDFDLLAEIVRRVSVPLVLHGGSGIPADQVQRAISLGIAKFNVGTNIHVAMRAAISGFLDDHPDSHDMTRILGAARSAAQDVVEKAIDTCGSSAVY